MSETLDVIRNHFTTEEEALAEIGAMGWHSYVTDHVITEDEEWHWHDFEAVVYLVRGNQSVELQDRRIDSGPGCFARAPAGVIHRELAGTNCRVVFGFPVPVTELTQPVNKPCEELEAFLRG